MRLDTAQLFDRLLALLAPDLILDVGSMDGAQARRFRTRRPDARIVAFEANPDNVACMREDPALARDRIELRPSAAWHRDETLAFHVERGAPVAGGEWRRGISSTRRRRRGSLGTVDVRVPAVRLDRFVESLAPPPRRIALWIDVEGAAFEVLEGARGIADRVVLVHVEVEALEVWRGQRLAADVQALMADLGLVELARGWWHVQHDVVFVSRKSLAEAGPRLRGLTAAEWLRTGLPRLARERLAARRLAGVFAQALAAARENPAVRDALGTPLEPVLGLEAGLAATAPEGATILVIPVRGPRGEGALYGEVIRRGSCPELTVLEAFAGVVDQTIVLRTPRGTREA